MTGLDAGVREYVLAQPGAAEFLDAYLEVLEVTLPGFEREGKRYVTLAVGCTGGKHRSVAIAEQSPPGPAAAMSRYRTGTRSGVISWGWNLRPGGRPRTPGPSGSSPSAGGMGWPRRWPRCGG